MRNSEDYSNVRMQRNTDKQDTYLKQKRTEVEIDNVIMRRVGGSK